MSLFHKLPGERSDGCDDPSLAMERSTDDKSQSLELDHIFVSGNPTTVVRDPATIVKRCDPDSPAADRWTMTRVDSRCSRYKDQRLIRRDRRRGDSRAQFDGLATRRPVAQGPSARISSPRFEASQPLNPVYFGPQYIQADSPLPESLSTTTTSSPIRLPATSGVGRSGKWS